MKSFLWLTLLVSSFYPAHSQSLTADQAYEYLQNERHRADKILGDSDTLPVDSLQKAEHILLQALAYYHRSDVQALAKTNKYLFARKGDISLDLALIQTRLDKLDQAAQTLLYPLQGSSATVYAKYVNQEAAFSKLRIHPLIAPALARAQALERTFNSTALATPYQPNIGQDEKVAGLSKLWSEAKYNFAYFDHIPSVDWDKLYLEYLPKIRATSSTVAYLHVLEQFCAQLRDGHTDVWASDPVLSDSVSRRPPIRTVLIADKVFVQAVLSDSLLASGIQPGLELVSIDNVPTRLYADQSVRPYQSGSTVQNIDVNTYTYDLLKGPIDKAVRLTFRDNQGRSFDRILPRTGYSKLKATPVFTFRVLAGNVAYVQLNSFDSNQALNDFKAAFDSIAATKALIIDIRLNGGGDSGVGWNILGYLTDKPMQTGSYTTRIYSPLRRARGEGVTFEAVEGGNSWPANGKKVYTKPVVVLTGNRTFSAAEDFAVVFDAMKRGVIIGEPTGGSTGQPLSFSLPGGVMARVCTKRDMYPDGREWVGQGVQPDIVVRPTVADMQAGRDTLLESALAHVGLSPAKHPLSKPKRQGR